MKIRSLFIHFLLPLLACSQVVPDKPRQVKNYFRSWYQEAVKTSKKRVGLEDQILSLYLTAVNGYSAPSGNVEHLSRVIPPGGKYSLVQNALTYLVIDQFPARVHGDYASQPRGWGAVIDSISLALLNSEKVIEPLSIHPNKYRVPGLPLNDKRNKELGELLDKDLVEKGGSGKESWVEPTERLVRGRRFELVSGYIDLIQPHWGNRWIYRSFPTIQLIIIDKSATQALLRYGIHNGGGYAHFEKTEFGWRPTESTINILQ